MGPSCPSCPLTPRRRSWGEPTAPASAWQGGSSPGMTRKKRAGFGKKGGWGTEQAAAHGPSAVGHSRRLSTRGQQGTLHAERSGRLCDCFCSCHSPTWQSLRPLPRLLFRCKRKCALISFAPQGPPACSQGGGWAPGRDVLHQQLQRHSC